MKTNVQCKRSSANDSTFKLQVVQKEHFKTVSVIDLKKLVQIVCLQKWQCKIYGCAEVSVKKLKNISPFAVVQKLEVHMT